MHLQISKTRISTSQDKNNLIWSLVITHGEIPGLARFSKPLPTWWLSTCPVWWLFLVLGTLHWGQSRSFTRHVWCESLQLLCRKYLSEMLFVEIGCEQSRNLEFHTPSQHTYKEMNWMQRSQRSQWTSENIARATSATVFFIHQHQEHLQWVDTFFFFFSVCFVLIVLKILRMLLKGRKILYSDHCFAVFTNKIN